MLQVGPSLCVAAQSQVNVFWNGSHWPKLWQGLLAHGLTAGGGGHPMEMPEMMATGSLVDLCFLGIVKTHQSHWSARIRWRSERWCRSLAGSLSSRWILSATRPTICWTGRTPLYLAPSRDRSDRLEIKGGDGLEPLPSNCIPRLRHRRVLRACTINSTSDTLGVRHT